MNKCKFCGNNAPSYDQYCSNFCEQKDFDKTCNNREYRCECGFEGKERDALDHQTTCDNPMEVKGDRSKV